MKTENSFYGCLHGIAPALCIAVATVSTQAGPLIDQDVSAQVDGKLPSERVAAGQPPVRRTRLAPARIDRDSLRFDAAMMETDLAELPVRTVEVLDDATMVRGRSRGLPVAQAPVYLQLDSCLRGHFLNDDETSGLGTWFAQARFDCPPGYPLCQERGWQAGGQITGYEVSYFFCSNSSANDCSVEVELWDGDPLGILDTVCNPTPSPIAGTKTTFSGLTRGVYHDLRAHLPTPVTYNCDRVWIAVSLIEGCRGSWLVGGRDYYSCWRDLAEFGWGDVYGHNWGCQQFGSCDTPSGYNAGTCCTTGEACDYTDADPSNWTGDCQEGGAWPPDCPSQCWGFFTHPTFCSDGIADGYYFDSFYQYYYYAQPGAVYAATDKYIALVPVSADAPPDQNPTPDGWRISGNEIILANPGRPVWLELRIRDWDPDHTGIKLKVWEAKIDSSGYSSGLHGPLTPYAPSCTTDADCEALMGSLGPPWGCAQGGCGPIGWPAGSCIPAWIDNSRTDYIFANLGESCGVALTTLDYRYGSSAYSPIDSPHIGDMYAGTLVLAVPPGATGTFTIDLDPISCGLIDEHGQPVPLLGFIPAKITVEIGSCCYQLGGEYPPCVDGMTRSECDALPGPRVFTPGGSCADGCPEPGGCCLPDYSCEEMLPHQCAEQGGRGVDECLGDLDGNGLDDACLLEPVPTVSMWGLIIMALVLTVAAKVYFARRPTVSANS